MIYVEPQCSILLNCQENDLNISESDSKLVHKSFYCSMDVKRTKYSSSTFMRLEEVYKGFVCVCACDECIKLLDKDV